METNGNQTQWNEPMKGLNNSKTVNRLIKRVLDEMITPLTTVHFTCVSFKIHTFPQFLTQSFNTKLIRKESDRSDMDSSRVHS